MKICIVTFRHISYNPRVVKEADTLTFIGHDVSVVTVCNNSAQTILDDVIMASRTWRLLTIKSRKQGDIEMFRWLLTGIRQRLFVNYLSSITLECGVAERAQGREYPELRRIACSVKADFYIAHHAECLGAAYAAAKQHNARFAFDAEDFHSGMFASSMSDSLPNELKIKKLLEQSERQHKCAEQKRIEYLERKYLPLCDYITAASDGIGEAYAIKYNLPLPTTILNVFPLETLSVRTDEPVDGAKDFIHHSPFTIHDPQTLKSKIENLKPKKLYWYSQVIGPGRGLEEAVEALALLQHPCELHLRGTSSEPFVTELTRLATKLGVQDRLFFYPPCSPDDLIAEAAQYDIGLALENTVEMNRLICVTNKIFTYMNAGLAIIATDTIGQRGIMAQAPDVGLLCRMNDAESLAAAINCLLESPELFVKCRLASRRAAEERFNWEVESGVVVGLIAKSSIQS